MKNKSMFDILMEKPLYDKEELDGMSKVEKGQLLRDLRMADILEFVMGYIVELAEQDPKTWNMTKEEMCAFCTKLEEIFFENREYSRSISGINCYCQIAFGLPKEIRGQAFAYETAMKMLLDRGLYYDFFMDHCEICDEYDAEDVYLKRENILEFLQFSNSVHKCIAEGLEDDKEQK